MSDPPAEPSETTRDDLSDARRRRLSAVPPDALPLGEDAIELVSEDPEPEVAHDRPDETAALGAEAPVEAYLDSPDSPAEAGADTEDSADDGVDDETDDDSDDSRRHEPPSRKPVKKTRGRASVPSWDEIMFGGGKQRLPAALTHAGTAGSLRACRTSSPARPGSSVASSSSELVDHREGTIYVLVREGSLPGWRRDPGWGSDRVIPVVGDLGEPASAWTKPWVDEHRGKIDHFFHLAAIYDMTADDATNEAMNVDGTRHALELADCARGRLLPPGLARSPPRATTTAPFDETMFDEGQHLPSPYHRTKFESERIVREEATVPWRVYRPAIVVGRLRDRHDGQGRRPLLLLPA